MKTMATNPTEGVLKFGLNADGPVLSGEAVATVLPGGTSTQRGDQPTVERVCGQLAGLSSTGQQSN